MRREGPHYRRVADLIRKRVLHGDYSIKPIPSERQLALEFDVNYMTVRRGLQLLLNEGLLMRQSNGRIKVRTVRSSGRGRTNVAMLVSTFHSSDSEQWRLSLEACAAANKVSVRTVLYVHWNDPLLLDALKGFDGAFIYPESETIPENVLEKLRRPEHPVVMLGADFSGLEIPSINLFPAVCVQQLLNHLSDLGRTRIACFNSQPDYNKSIQERIDQWRFWMAAHRYRGKLYNHPIDTHLPPAVNAFNAMNHFIANRSMDEEAVLCTTIWAAVGVVRACLDHGIRPGKDLAIAAVNGEGVSAMMNPRLTALETPDAKPYLDYCLDWMASGDRQWTGPLLLSPAQVPLSVGGTTVPE